MSLLGTFTREEKLALREHGLAYEDHSQLSDSFVLGMRYQKKQTISFEDFVVQHNRLQIIMEEYNLSLDLIKQSFEKELINLIELSKYADKLAR